MDNLAPLGGWGPLRMTGDLCSVTSIEPTSLDHTITHTYALFPSSPRIYGHANE